jgi:hypothetical protein
MSLDHALGDRQPKAVAVDVVLGRVRAEEGLEDIAQVFLRDARPAVQHFDVDQIRSGCRATSTVPRRRRA